MENSAAAPQELNLAGLTQDLAFRSDLLFFIRLAGTYCQTIFWAAFAKSAKKRRKAMLQTAAATIKGDNFRNAVLEPEKRHRQTTDIFHRGFVTLLQDLAKLPRPKTGLSINDNFTKGLRERHGLAWSMQDFIDAVDIMREYRGFLEHYQKRREKGRIPAAPKSAKLIAILGQLLLPQFCNALEHSAKRVKDEKGAHIGGALAETLRELLQTAKAERKAAIGAMFAQARSRSNMYAKGQEKTKGGKYKTKKQKSYELLNGKWRRYYCGLKLSRTDLRENSFKRYYDFIGRQNFKQIYALLGSPLDDEKLKNFDENNAYDKNYVIYASERPRLSFRYDIIPFYTVAMRLQKILHFYLDYAPTDKKGKIQDRQLKEIRDTIAHNGLFWQVKNLNAAAGESPFLSVKNIFYRIMKLLAEQTLPLDRSIFYNSVKTLLEAENCAIAHIEAAGDEPPATVKIHKFKKNKKKAADTAMSHKDARPALRLALTKWEKNLQAANLMLKKDLKTP